MQKEPTCVFLVKRKESIHWKIFSEKIKKTKVPVHLPAFRQNTGLPECKNCAQAGC